MTRRRSRQLTQTIAYIFTAIVALSMIISLVGPVLFREPAQPTPTWPPTWTPIPTFTEVPTLAIPTAEQTPTGIPTGQMPTGTPTGQVPTWTPTITATEPVSTPVASTTISVTEPAAPLAFAVCGDNAGSDALYARLLKKVQDDGNAFLIHTGDLVTHSSKRNYEAFQRLMADFPLPFYPVPGNHDGYGDSSLTRFTEFSGAPAPRYSFDADGAHFTMVNSASGRLDEEQLTWIDQNLATSDQSVKIVVLHYPPFDPNGTDHILLSGNDEFMALMRKHNVAYVFAGHIHAYSEAERDGTTYVITGGAGAGLYAQDHPNAFHHYVRVTVDGAQVSTEVVRIE